MPNLALRVVHATLALCLLGALAGGEAAPFPLKSGQTVLLLGDSITAQGSGAQGWASLLKSGLAANGIEITTVNGGASGANSDNVLGNLARHLKAAPPDVLLLNCGVNDAKAGGNACPIEKYRTNLDTMLEQAGKARIRVLLWTTVAWECHQPGWAARRQQIADFNAALVPYNEHLRLLAKRGRIPLIDVNAEALRLLATPLAPEEALTVDDGIHPSAKGHLFLARTMLRGLGLGKEAMARAEAAWKAEAGGKPAPKRKD